jgi:hypothetical protein
MQSPFEKYNQGDKANTPKIPEQSLDKRLDRFFDDEEGEFVDGNWIITKRNKILSPEEGLEEVELGQEAIKPLSKPKTPKPNNDLDLNRRLDRFFPNEFDNKD